MPSGAKKRKAAKKKKENHSTNSSSAPTHSHGDEDHQNLPMEGEEEEIEKESKPSNLPSMEELRIESGEKNIRVEESAIQVEREFKIENELNKKHGGVEHDEATRKSYDGGSSRSSSSSSSSSDDESQGIKNRRAETNIASIDSVKVADSLSGSGKSIEASRDLPIAEAGESVIENKPVTDSEKILVSSEQVEVYVHSPADISVAPFAVESAFKENQNEMSVEDKICTSRKEEAIIQYDESNATTSDAKECVTQENDDRSTSPYNAPRATADNRAEHMKDSVVTQPVLGPPPFPVQKTSWTSCCGLFEVFSRSGT